MANGSSFFTFLAGAAVGAAVAIFLTTDKGERVMEQIKNKGDEWLDDGMEAVSRGLDKLEDALTKDEDPLADVDKEV